MTPSTATAYIIITRDYVGTSVGPSLHDPPHTNELYAIVQQCVCIMILYKCNSTLLRSEISFHKMRVLSQHLATCKSSMQCMWSDDIMYSVMKCSWNSTILDWTEWRANNGNYLSVPVCLQQPLRPFFQFDEYSYLFSSAANLALSLVAIILSLEPIASVCCLLSTSLSQPLFPLSGRFWSV